MKCRKCGKEMNPIDALVGYDSYTKTTICSQCAKKEHKKAIKGTLQ